MIISDFLVEGAPLDTFTMVPLPKTTPLNYFEVNGTKENNLINSLKINDGTSYWAAVNDAGAPIDEPILKDIAIQERPIQNYDMMTSFDSSKECTTLVDAQFAGTLSAGNLSLADEVDYISILRLGPEDNYKAYKEIAIVNWVDGVMKYSTRDYLIDSHAVYFYSIRVITNNGTYGTILRNKEALNTYEYDWIISDQDTRLLVLDSKISSITYNSKDGVIEPIGANYAIVNRLSNLNYRSFTLTGTISSQTDFDGSLGIATRNNQDIPEAIKNRIESIYKSKLGAPRDAIRNSMLVDLNQERLIKEQAMNILNDGRPKLFKSPTEGLMYVKLSKVQLTPEAKLNRYIGHFSAQVTEIGPVTEEVLDQFKIIDRNYTTNG